MLANARHESSLVFLIHALRLCCVHQTIHVVSTSSTTVAIFIICGEAAHAGASTCAACLSLVVPSKRVTPSKATSTSRANVRSLPGVKLCVTLQIMKSSETRLAGLTHKRLFLAMGEQMALEIMLPREFGRTVGASVFLRGRRARATSVIARVG